MTQQRSPSPHPPTSELAPLTRWQQRLADELADDGVVLTSDARMRHLILEELDHCRRAPVFEGRQPSYGAMILDADGSQERRRAVNDHAPFDIVPLDGGAMVARTYADGRSSYLVRDMDGRVALACFERSMVFEIDLVRLQQLTGGAIVQRTPVFDVVRIFVDDAVISWDGRHWQSRPTARSLHDALTSGSPELGERLADVAELAIHWLAPSRVGATIVIGDGELEAGAFDVATAMHTPALSVSDRRHYAALVTVLRQHDLAVLVDKDGVIRKVAVGLRWSEAAETAIDNDRGMRHRSAQRYSYDQGDVTVVVVSEDGPVTFYRHGDVLVTTRAAAPDEAATQTSGP